MVKAADKEPVDFKEGKSKGGKAKKKWSKARVHEKLNNAVLFDKATWDKAVKEIPQMKLITPSLVSERLKITASLARRAIMELEKKGLVRPVLRTRSLSIYTRAGNQ